MLDKLVERHIFLHKPYVAFSAAGGKAGMILERESAERDSAEIVLHITKKR